MKFSKICVIALCLAVLGLVSGTGYAAERDRHYGKHDQHDRHYGRHDRHDRHDRHYGRHDRHDRHDRRF